MKSGEYVFYTGQILAWSVILVFVISGAILWWTDFAGSTLPSEYHATFFTGVWHALAIEWQLWPLFRGFHPLYPPGYTSGYDLGFGFTLLYRIVALGMIVKGLVNRWIRWKDKG